MKLRAFSRSLNLVLEAALTNMQPSQVGCFFLRTLYSQSRFIGCAVGNEWDRPDSKYDEVA